MPDLYSLGEFDTYVQGTVDTQFATLLRTLVTGLISGVDGKDYTTEPVTTTVKAIALEAAARRYRNPEGLSSLSIDDYTARWDGAAQLGLYLTADEIAQLRPPGRNRVYSVRLTAEHGA